MDSSGGVAKLTLGQETIELVLTPGGRPYPEPRAANDPWFQHFAISVRDMDAAYARLNGFGHEPISVGGPQQLPPSTGSVIAYKFRDPDGHPLELSYVPGRAFAQGDSDEVFIGIDHTALAVTDLERSVAFYTSLGFRLDGRGFNTGPEQDRLDGLEGGELDIAILRGGAGPHLELLHYRAPASQRIAAVGPADLCATTTVIRGAAQSANQKPHLIDPDGHRLLLVSQSAETRDLT